MNKERKAPKRDDTVRSIKGTPDGPTDGPVSAAQQ
jgi:hypothetical protein